MRPIVLVLLAAVLLTIAWTADSDAKPWSACRYIGTFNGYAQTNPDDTWDLPVTVSDVKPTFVEHQCRRPNGIRIVKSKANTEAEVVELADWAAQRGVPGLPVLLCRHSPARATMIDLAHFAGNDPTPPMNRVERTRWPQWARSYADNHDCEVIR